MIESLVGFETATTRQKEYGDGMTAKPKEEVGEVKSGGGLMDSARVIVVSGKEKFMRFSHGPALTAGSTGKTIKNERETITVISFR